MDAAELATAAGSRPVGDRVEGWRVDHLTTDSRAARGGSVFVALVGENFDGNDFSDDAISRGARVVVCSRGRALDRRGVAFVEVDDTTRALGDIAAAHRRRFDIPVVAITGSNGKTTTKELLRSILAETYGEDAVLATAGNFNNLVGLPLTVMHLTARHRVAVLEMGMNAPGEIARLTEIARPTHGLITCVASAHLEGLGTIEGIARAKGELFAGLGPDATAVVNLDDARVAGLVRELHHGRNLRYGTGGSVHVGAVDEVSLARARFELVFEDVDGARESGGAQRRIIELPLGGRHNTQNAVAAAACARSLGLTPDDIARGLAGAEPPPMRVAVETLANGVCIVNDAYNANPHSFTAALATLAEGAEGRAIVVLGEMLELGSQAAQLHCQAGRDAAGVDPVLLCALGEHAVDVARGAVEAGMTADRVLVSGSYADIARAIAGVWRSGDAVLVKGSRGARMERVVEEMRRLGGA